MPAAIMSDAEIDIEFKNRPLLKISAKINNLIHEAGLYEQYEVEEIHAGLDLLKAGVFAAMSR